jgi:hypothetical protein
MPELSKLRDASDLGVVLSAAALNGAAATRTVALLLGKRFTRMTVQTTYTYSAATSVSITPTVSIDGGSTYASKTSELITSGAAALSVYVQTLTGTASFVIVTTYDVEGCDYLKLVYAGGGAPAAGDLITARAIGTLVVQ